MRDLGKKVQEINQLLSLGSYTVAAKESVGIIEHALRELLRRQITHLQSKDRLRVNQAEMKIGKGQKGIEDFGMGELVGVMRSSAFLKNWAKATGSDLTGILLINLDAVVSLRNKLVHQNHEATRGDAKLLFEVMRTFLETFGILSLEDADGIPLSFPNFSGPAEGHNSETQSAPQSRHLRFILPIAAVILVLVITGLYWLGIRREVESPGYTGAPITLNLENANIRDVFATFSELTGLNIVVDNDVSGTADVNVKDVPWDQALDLVIKQNGLAYTLEGSVLRVHQPE